MADSHKKFNYRLRPAKSIERKMLAEAFRKLSVFDHVENYKYVGMGSLYFADFMLFHRQLGFKQMVSIELGGDAEKEARFKFNVPFNCVKLLFGRAAAILPHLPWDVRTVVWLDYDGILTSEVLGDISTVVTKAASGSLFLVSVNAQLHRYQRRTPKGRTTPLNGLKSYVGAGRVAPTLKEPDLFGWGIAKVCRDIVHNEIAETLNRRNKGILEEELKVNYQQLFNFHYADGAEMLTVGGIFFEERDSGAVTKAAFNALEFYRPSADPYMIGAPILTFREIHALESELPTLGTSAVPVPKEDIENYSRVYRYFPHFTEAEI